MLSYKNQMTYKDYTRDQLREMVNGEHFFKVKNVSHKKALKAILIQYLEEYGETAQSIENSINDSLHEQTISTLPDPPIAQKVQNPQNPQNRTIRRNNSVPDFSKLLVSKPIDAKLPKIKEFVPNPAIIQEIREKKPIEEPKPAPVPIELDEEEVKNLDEEDKDVLRNIVGGDISEYEPAKKQYEIDEKFEEKIRGYVQIYPDLKKIANSPEFESSEEKLVYIERYLNKNLMNVEIVNLLLGGLTIIEQHPVVNQHIKLHGYTRDLAINRVHLEKLLDELAVKHSDGFIGKLQMPVEARIVALFAQSALNTHFKNGGTILGMKF